MLWGITRESLDAWLSTGDDSDPNEIKGFAACSGVVEGTARIVKWVEEISRLQKGDILVCQVTNPNLGADLQQDRRGGLRHRRLDEPCGHRRARVRPAGGGRHRQRHLAHQGWSAHPRRWRARYRHHPALAGRERMTVNDSEVDRLVCRFGSGGPAAGRRQGRQSRASWSGPALPCRRDSSSRRRHSSASWRRLKREAPVRARRGSAGCGRSGRRSRRCRSQLRARIEAAPLPAADCRGDRARLRASSMRRQQAAVAVRSSATTEDAADASFAGLQDTYLWVQSLEQTLDKVRSCWGEPVFGRVDHLSAPARLRGRGRRHGRGRADHGGCANRRVSCSRAVR